MGSATSCFNSTLYRKTMTRFWPLWALYGVIWAFLIPLNLLNQFFWLQERYQGELDLQSMLTSAALDIPYLLTMGVALSLVFGALAAMASFGYLYNNRSAAMMHALPLRREALFTTQYLAGLSCLLLPHLAVALVTAAAALAFLPMECWGEALAALAVWLLVQSGTALFFFSFAAFCAMFTGHILALPAFYVILNFLVMVISTLLAELMNRFFYGFPGRGWVGGRLVEWCTPVYLLSQACNWNVVQTGESGAAVTREWGLASPSTVAIYAVAGLVFALLALLVYRHRHVESAGDVVSIPLVRPIFKYGVSFCAGLCFGTFTSTFLGWQADAVFLTACVLFWTVAGYFTAEMLLKKSFRVWKSWKGCAAVAAAMALLCAACVYDLFGVESRIPDADQVASINLSADMGYPMDISGFHLYQITEPGQIQQVLDLHQAIINERDRNGADNYSIYGDDYIFFYVTYTLKDGSTLSREYSSVPIFLDELDKEGSVTQLADQLIQNRGLISMVYNFASFEEQGRLVEAYLTDVRMLPNSLSPEGEDRSTLYLDGAAGEDLEGLWEAVKADFADGSIGVRYLFSDEERLRNTYRTDLRFQWELPLEEQSGRGGQYAPAAESSPVGQTYSSSLSITLTPNASRTLEWLRTFSGLGSQYELVLHDEETAVGSVSTGDTSVATPYQEAVLAD